MDKFFTDFLNSIDFQKLDQTTQIPTCFDKKTQNILQYFVDFKTSLPSFRNCIHESTDCSKDLHINPIYSWQGLIAATTIWNTGINRWNELCSGDPSTCGKPLNPFLTESTPMLQKMTLAAFLANAVIESGNFLVCKEGLGDCPANQARYCNNCDNADVKNYSCSPDNDGKCTRGWQCSMLQCEWMSDEQKKKTTKRFLPTACTLVGKNIQGNQILSDPCMTIYNISNKPSTCTDFKETPIDEQQYCYYGRGLVQLTWSCNYANVQNSLEVLYKVFIEDQNWLNKQSDLIKDFVNIYQKQGKDSINICKNPDAVCGSYSMNGNEVIYNPSIVFQAMPWITSIEYWTRAVDPIWHKSYSFYSSVYEGIKPSGDAIYDRIGNIQKGTTPGRLDAYKIILSASGILPNPSLQVTKSDVKLINYTPVPPSPTYYSCNRGKCEVSSMSTKYQDKDSCNKDCTPMTTEIPIKKSNILLIILLIFLCLSVIVIIIFVYKR